MTKTLLIFFCVCRSRKSDIDWFWLAKLIETNKREMKQREFTLFLLYKSCSKIFSFCLDNSDSLAYYKFLWIKSTMPIICIIFFLFWFGVVWCAGKSQQICSMEWNIEEMTDVSPETGKTKLTVWCLIFNATIKIHKSSVTTDGSRQ